MALLDIGRLIRAAGQTIQGLPENRGVMGGLSLMSANQPGQTRPVDQPGSFLKGMLQANSLKQNRLALEEAAKEKARQEDMRIQREQARASLMATLPPQQRLMYSALGDNPDVIKSMIASQNPGMGDTTADISNYNFFNTLSEEDQQTFLTLKRLDPKTAGAISAAQTRGKQGGVNLTPIQENIDTQFGATAAKYLTGGKAQDTANIENLREKIKILNDGSVNVSGGEFAVMPEVLMAQTHPEALAFVGDIRDIVFQSLRDKLGAQFTEKEGDRLVAAAFDQRLPEQTNVKRLERLLKVIESTSASKQGMIDYYSENGTLQGYESATLTVDSLLNQLKTGDMAETLKLNEKTPDEIKQMHRAGDDETKDAIEAYLKEQEANNVIT